MLVIMADNCKCKDISELRIVGVVKYGLVDAEVLFLDSKDNLYIHTINKTSMNEKHGVYRNRLLRYEHHAMSRIKMWVERHGRMTKVKDKTDYLHLILQGV